jgi:tetratricopeptide (TPR) repeat protein
MPDPFRSSDEYDEQAHQLYNQGRYDEALEVLKDGLAIYPAAVELHVGMGYAYLAREEYAWARQSFLQALALEPDHEDALAGFGETRLRVGDREGALASFAQVLELGFHEDHDLMLQIGRALFRDNLAGHAHRFFELAATAEPECPDAAACLGYVSHRLGREAAALFWLRRALEIDPAFAEPRIYLANLLYDRGESAAALTHFNRTEPSDHYEELGIYRVIELRRTFYRVPDGDAGLAGWLDRLTELTGVPDPVDDLLAEIEAVQPDGSVRDPAQLELFGTLHSEPPQMQRKPAPRPDHHQVATLAGQTLRGTWEEILAQLKAADQAADRQSLTEFMAGQARRGREETGVIIPLTDAESFIRGSAEAGVLRIIH